MIQPEKKVGTIQLAVFIFFVCNYNVDDKSNLSCVKIEEKRNCEIDIFV